MSPLRSRMWPKTAAHQHTALNAPYARHWPYPTPVQVRVEPVLTHRVYPSPVYKLFISSASHSLAFEPQKTHTSARKGSLFTHNAPYSSTPRSTPLTPGPGLTPCIILVVIEIRMIKLDWWVRKLGGSCYFTSACVELRTSDKWHANPWRNRSG